MGHLSTVDMIGEGGTSDAVLGWHLESNHYPPLRDAVGLARLALAAVEEGRGDEPLDTGPDVPTPRRAPSAFAVIESWHLEHFLADDAMANRRAS